MWFIKQPSFVGRQVSRLKKARQFASWVRALRADVLAGLGRVEARQQADTDVSASCLEAGVHLVEAQQRVEEQLGVQHAMVLRRLALISDELAELRQLIRDDRETIPTPFRQRAGRRAA